MIQASAWSASRAPGAARSSAASGSRRSREPGSPLAMRPSEGGGVVLVEAEHEPALRGAEQVLVARCRPVVLELGQEHVEGAVLDEPDDVGIGEPHRQVGGAGERLAERDGQLGYDVGAVGAGRVLFPASHQFACTSRW